MNQEPKGEQTKGTTRVPEKVLDAIRAVLEFYWLDEFHHYSALSPEERKEHHHVFEDLTQIRRWVNRIHGGKRLNGNS